MTVHQQKQFVPQSSESGLTIIECLVAMLIVSILMAVIAPMVALSVGTRVQARRVERATQAARAYIDGVSAGTIAAPAQTASVPLATNVAAPTSSGSLTCTTSTTGYCSNIPASSLYCFDIDGGGCSASSPQDLVVQAFRTNQDQNYLLGLRVYRADGFSNTNPLVKSDSTNKRTQATFTGGMGNYKAPLVEMTTEISTDKPSLSALCTRLGGC
jgi:prepilin-type N-terminal cleavage/methylation domain-containing protein